MNCKNLKQGIVNSNAFRARQRIQMNEVGDRSWERMVRSRVAWRTCAPEHWPLAAMCVWWGTRLLSSYVSRKAQIQTFTMSF